MAEELIENAPAEAAEGEVNAALANAGYEVPVALPIPPGAEVIKTITLWLAT